MLKVQLIIEIISLLAGLILLGYSLVYRHELVSNVCIGSIGFPKFIKRLLVANLIFGIAVVFILTFLVVDIITSLE